MSLRLMKIADGFSSSAVPSDLLVSSGSYATYLSQADFVTALARPAQNGDIFFNSTSEQVETYQDGNWFPAEDELMIDALNLVDGSELEIIPAKRNQTFCVSGDVGNCTLSNTPFGTVAPKKGATITLIGLDDSKAPKIENADVDYGCLQNGDITFKKGKSVTYRWTPNILRYVDVGDNL